MPILNWVALSIAHRFKFTDTESHARRREGFQIPAQSSGPRGFLVKQLSVPISFIVPALDDPVRCRKPLQKELTNLSGEMIACAMNGHVIPVLLICCSFSIFQIVDDVLVSEFPSHMSY